MNSYMLFLQPTAIQLAFMNTNQSSANQRAKPMVSLSCLILSGSTANKELGKTMKVTGREPRGIFWGYEYIFWFRADNTATEKIPFGNRHSNKHGSR